MTLVLIILALISGVGLVAKEFLSKPTSRKKLWAWRISVFCGVVTLITVALAFFPSDSPPLTRQDTASLLDSAVDRIQQTYSCDRDSLWALLDQIASGIGSDSACRMLAHEQAACLSGIVTTAIDSCIVAIGLRDYKVALMHADYALMAATTDSAKHEALMSKAMTYQLMAGDLAKQDSADSSRLAYQRAADAYQDVISVAPSDSDAWFLAGYCESRIGNHSKAIHQLTSAINLFKKPENRATVWYRIALTYAASGQHQLAVQAFDTTLTYDSSKSPVWGERGISLFELRRIPEAVTSFTEALTINPEDTNVWYNNGFAYMALSLADSSVFPNNTVESFSQLDSAIRYLKGALDRGCDPGRVYTALALVYAMTRDFSAALPLCDSAVKYETPYKSNMLQLRQVLSTQHSR